MPYPGAGSALRVPSCRALDLCRSRCLTPRALSVAGGGATPKPSRVRSPAISPILLCPARRSWPWQGHHTASQPASALYQETPSPLGKQLHELLQRLRVQNVLRLEPSTSRLADAVLHGLQAIDRVRIRSEGNLHAHVLRQAADVIIDVEPRRVRVELDVAIALLGGLQDSLQIDGISGAHTQQPPRRMRK